MNKKITLLAIGFMFTGAIACSSAQKHEEEVKSDDISKAQIEQTLEDSSVDTSLDAPAESVSSSTSSGSAFDSKPSSSTSGSNSNISLGGGSSGRGH